MNEGSYLTISPVASSYASSLSINNSHAEKLVWLSKPVMINRRPFFSATLNRHRRIEQEVQIQASFSRGSARVNRPCNFEAKYSRSKKMFTNFALRQGGILIRVLCLAICVLLFTSMGCSANGQSNPFRSNQPGYPNWSAFTGTKWKKDQPIVEFRGQWYELVKFHGVVVSTIENQLPSCLTKAVSVQPTYSWALSKAGPA
jgi:hypothetical protein